METLVDIPSAYEANITPFRSPLLESIGSIEQLVAKSRLDQVTIAERLELDASVLGVSFEEDPDGFIAARNEFFAGAQSKLEEILPATKTKTINMFATYLSDGYPEKFAEWTKTFEDRLANVQVIDIADDLMELGSGKFRDQSRKIVINGTVFMQIASGKKEFNQYLINHVLTHEIIHGMLTSALTTEALSFGPDLPIADLVSRNGLMTNHAPEKVAVRSSEIQLAHNWLNEAFIEDSRQQLVAEPEIAYKVEVSILRALKELDGNLWYDLEKTAFGPTGPGPLIGRLELLLGPLGVEEAGKILADKPAVVGDREVMDLHHKILALMPAHLRKKALTSMQKHWNEIKRYY